MMWLASTALPAMSQHACLQQCPFSSLGQASMLGRRFRHGLCLSADVTCVVGDRCSPCCTPYTPCTFISLRTQRRESEG